MAIKRTQRGFSLLVTVIFTSVMLMLGLALGSLGYKQQVLASTAIESQYAFYAADAGLECVLYEDQQLDQFNYLENSFGQPANINCHEGAPTQTAYSYNASRLYFSQRIPLDSNRQCADVTIYKYSSLQPGGYTTLVFSQGYDISCAAVTSGSGRFVSRGIFSKY